MTAGRRFAARLSIGGVVPVGAHVVEFTVDSSRYGRCDTAVIVLAIEASAGIAWFQTVTGAGSDVVLQMADLAAVGASWTAMFRGVVDHVEWRPDGRIVTLECRDYLARLVDLRVQASWANLVGSELIEAVAAAAGLGARVSFPASMTGQFWQVEHKRSAVLAQHRFQTAFDLAAFVAREAGCDLYADGPNVVCVPQVQAGDPGASVVDVSQGVIERALGRDCQLAQGLVVHVASWDSRQRSATHVYFDGRGFSTTAPVGAAVMHSFRVPGRRSEEVRAIAVQKYRRILAHAVSARITLPGQIGLGPRSFVTGVAVDGPWGGTLTVDAVRSEMSVGAGFVQRAVVRLRAVGGG